jgi:two-component system NarL family response regulator
LRTRVVLADDHKLFREALRNMLQRHPDIAVVGEAGDGIEAVELVGSLLPDVLVMDIRMPRLNGIAAIAQLLAAHPSVKVIVLSVNAEHIFASEMLTAGARGYVTKSDAEELPRAIRAVMNDIEYLSMEVAASADAPARTDNPINGAS